ncbi:MAG: phosphatidate cytidylyltransferase [Mariniblastus sp.]|nr:phosphatidate cytidylyltransferase [Mariniblastus sp.]
MLGRRLISAAIIITAIVSLLCLDFWLGKDEVLGRPGLAVCILAIIAAAMTASELVQMFSNVACRVNHTVVVGATIAMVAVSSAPVMWTNYPNDCPLGEFGWVFSGLILAIVMMFGIEMLKFKSPTGSSQGEVIDRLGRSTLIFVYVAMCFGFLIPHRFLQDGNGYGIIAIVTLISTVKMADSFAYFVGKSFGTKKLAPILSPGKTLQGSLGAPIGGCVAAAICVFVVAPHLFEIEIQKPWWWFLAYGILVSAAGMMGDLAESLVKRDCNTKDSSSWLPGLGGVLDILDSAVFAAPISYFLWIVAELPSQTGN